MGRSVFGVIAPHPPIFVPAVGGQRALTARASLDALARCATALERFAPDAVVLISPHAPARFDSFAIDDAEWYEGSLEQFGDSRPRRYAGDRELARTIAHHARARGVPCVVRADDPRLETGWLDHASIVPLSFLDAGSKWPVVVLSLSGAGYEHHRALGEAVASSAQALGRRVAFIASGDMSHRLTPDAPAGFSPRASELDREIRKAVESGSLSELARIDPRLIEAGGECGLRSLITLGGYCGSDPVPSRVLAYEGPWGVGYLTALVGASALELDTDTPPIGIKGGAAGQPESEIVALARTTIEQYVHRGIRPSSPSLMTGTYPPRAGAFVSLHRKGDLRGCIGTILPTRATLAEEVVANAIEAATRDPRFPPLEEAELADLEISVDVLQEPESCSLSDLDPTRYGVIVSSGWRRGLLLPDLEGVDDVQAQVAIAMRKAGIRAGEACTYERFQVDRYT